MCHPDILIAFFLTLCSTLDDQGQPRHSKSPDGCFSRRQRTDRPRYKKLPDGCFFTTVIVTVPTRRRKTATVRREVLLCTQHPRLFAFLINDEEERLRSVHIDTEWGSEVIPGIIVPNGVLGRGHPFTAIVVGGGTSYIRDRCLCVPSYLASWDTRGRLRSAEA